MTVCERYGCVLVVMVVPELELIEVESYLQRV